MVILIADFTLIAEDDLEMAGLVQRVYSQDMDSEIIENMEIVLKQRWASNEKVR